MPEMSIEKVNNIVGLRDFTGSAALTLLTASALVPFIGLQENTKVTSSAHDSVRLGIFIFSFPVSVMFFLRLWSALFTFDVSCGCSWLSFPDR